MKLEKEIIRICKERNYIVDIQGGLKVTVPTKKFPSSSKFNDEYEVLTRVSYVKKSSMGFENIVRLKDGTILASAEATMVHYNVNNNEPERVNDYLRTLLRIFEGDNIEL